jgi:hypothetical protein
MAFLLGDVGIAARVLGGRGDEPRPGGIPPLPDFPCAHFVRFGRALTENSLFFFLKVMIKDVQVQY